jgi:hypothetical protein
MRRLRERSCPAVEKKRGRPKPPSLELEERELERRDLVLRIERERPSVGPRRPREVSFLPQEIPVDTMRLDDVSVRSEDPFDASDRFGPTAGAGVGLGRL